MAVVGLVISVMVIVAITAALQIDPPDTEPHGLVYQLKGYSVNDEFGQATAPLGDIDGDGFNDLLIGAHNGDIGFTNSGAARVYSGRDGSLLFTSSGAAKGSHHGSGVSGAGDIDKDGVNDIIVGVISDNDARVGPGGDVRIISTASGKQLFTFAGHKVEDNFGHAVAGVGDVNADGWPDVAVGAPGTWRKNIPGYVQVFSGRDGTALYQLQGLKPSKGDRFGFSLSGAGDINNDGFADLIVGAVGDSDRGYHSGAVYLFSGRNGTLLRRYIGTSKNQEMGHSVAQVADLDGDNLPETFAGSFHMTDYGYSRVYSSRDGSVIHEFRGDQKGDAFGHSVAAVGDVNGDGVEDLLVGAADARFFPEAYLPFFRSTPGYARVYSGASGAPLVTWWGRDNIHLGYVVSAAGDINNDGFADMILGTTIIGDIGEAWVVSACAVQNGEPSDKPETIYWRPSTDKSRGTGHLLLSGYSGGARGVITACKQKLEQPCSADNALFLLPFITPEDGAEIAIAFSPRQNRFAGEKIVLVGQLEDGSKVTNTVEALMCHE